MQRRKKPGQKSGGAKLRASGKKPILLGLTPEEHRLIYEASVYERRPMSQFVTFHALQVARGIVAAQEFARREAEGGAA